MPRWDFSNGVNNYLKPFLGRYEDSFQQAWVDILERNPQTLEEITPIVRRVRKKAIKKYMNKKYREVSLYTPIGKNRFVIHCFSKILTSATMHLLEEQKTGFRSIDSMSLSRSITKSEKVRSSLFSSLKFKGFEPL